MDLLFLELDHELNRVDDAPTTTVGPHMTSWAEELDLVNAFADTNTQAEILMKTIKRCNSLTLPADKPDCSILVNKMENAIRVLQIAVCAVWSGLALIPARPTIDGWKIDFDNNPVAACLFFSAQRHMQCLPALERENFAWQFRKAVGYLLQEALV